MVYRILKIFSIWLLFVAFHFGYKFFPGSVFMLFGCPVETIFHDMKMVFFSYLIIAVILEVHLEDLNFKPVT